MKEWDTNFVYDELNNNVNKDKLMIDLLDGKDNEKLVPKYKKLSEHGESAKDIKILRCYSMHLKIKLLLLLF